MNWMCMEALGRSEKEKREQIKKAREKKEREQVSNRVER